MSENPFEAQTTTHAGEIPPVGVKSAPSGLQFNLTVCLILAILGILGSCMGGAGLALTELTQNQSFTSPAAVAPAGDPSVTSDKTSFSIEMGSPSVPVDPSEGANISFDAGAPSVNGINSSFEILADKDATTGSDSKPSGLELQSQLQQVGRQPVLRISNVIILLFGLVTSIVLLLACIKGMRRQLGAPKSMAFALALAIFYKVTGIAFGFLGVIITWREMSNLIEGDLLDEPSKAALQFGIYFVIGFSVFAMFLAALMAGYYVYARGVFKRDDVLAYFDSK